MYKIRLWGCDGVSMKPILFNAEMVRAILDGRKTQTRRPIKSPSGVFQVCWRNIDPDNKWVEQVDENEIPTDKGVNPPYEPGDILYVRETWKSISAVSYEHKILIRYLADDFEQNVKFLPLERYCQFEKYLEKNGNHANIFMPKEAARIFLKVTDVRIEGIQDIDYNGAIAEGIEETETYQNKLDYNSSVGLGTGYLPISVFAELWNDLYKEKGYSWELNPWVWVIEFERCEKDD